MSGFYHQDERDEAVGRGCLLLLLYVVVAVATVLLAADVL
jgi:hypothetical protein